MRTPPHGAGARETWAADRAPPRSAQTGGRRRGRRRHRPAARPRRRPRWPGPHRGRFRRRGERRTAPRHPRRARPRPRGDISRPRAGSAMTARQMRLPTAPASGTVPRITTSCSQPIEPRPRGGRRVRRAPRARRARPAPAPTGCARRRDPRRARPGDGPCRPSRPAARRTPVCPVRRRDRAGAPLDGRQPRLRRGDDARAERIPRDRCQRSRPPSRPQRPPRPSRRPREGKGRPACGPFLRAGLARAVVVVAPAARESMAARMSASSASGRTRAAVGTGFTPWAPAANAGRAPAHPDRRIRRRRPPSPRSPSRRRLQAMPRPSPRRRGAARSDRRAPRRAPGPPPVARVPPSGRRVRVAAPSPLGSGSPTPPRPRLPAGHPRHAVVRDPARQRPMAPLIAMQATGSAIPGAGQAAHTRAGDLEMDRRSAGGG